MANPSNNYEKEKIGLKFELIELLEVKKDSIVDDLTLSILDLIKYRSGAFLWLYEDYSSLKEIFRLFGIQDFIKELALDGMRDVIEEFYDFIDQVNKKNPLLYQEEIEDSTKNYFEKTISPNMILFQKNYLIHYLYSQIKEFIEQNDIFPTNFPKKDILQLKNIIESNITDIKKNLKLKITQGIDAIVKNLRAPISNEDLLIESSSENINEELEKVKDKNFAEKFSNLIYFFLDALKRSSLPMIYEGLRLLKDFDSFNIQFTKFLNRLYHILTENNRDYKKKKDCYFLISPRYFNSRTRTLLKDFLRLKLRKRYQKLADFLLKIYANFNIFRRIEAHEIPDKIKISEDKKKTYIPRPGDVPDLEMNIDELSKIMTTYLLFIDALWLY
ncbi:MAG: hypothetical protein EU529_00725 [Promethearchaeota archaeon]|nr:MAG: hypothetical protein EU529_00725 [Candidatus Lokiarchaeota archaeon]